MRPRSLTKLVLAGALLALACVSDRNSSPTQPSQPNESPSTLLSPSTLSCDPLRIVQLIIVLYPAGRAVRTTQTFDQIQAALRAHSITSARALVFTFVGGLLADWKAGNLLDPKRRLGISLAQAVAELVARLYTCIGFTAPTNLSTALDPGGSGGAAVVTPSSTATQEVATGDHHAAVSFPPGSITQPALVIVVPTTQTLPTTLDQYPPVYDFSITPAQTFPPANKPTVGICVRDVDAVVYDRLQLAHPDPATPTSIEILHRVAAPADVDAACVTIGSLAPPQRSLAGRLWQRVAGWLRPAEAQAANALLLKSGGIGGQPGSFSPFAAVDPQSQLNFIVEPTTTYAGGPDTARVAVKDASGAVIKSYQGTVTVAITAGTGTPGAILSGTTTQTVVNGVATFSDLSIDKAGTGYTLTATAVSQTVGGVGDPTPAGGTSAAFNITSTTLWAPLTSGTSEALFSVWGSGGGNDVYAVGANGTIRHFNGTTWAGQTSGVSVTLFSVSGSAGGAGGGGDTVFAVGDTNAVLHTLHGGTDWVPEADGFGSGSGLRGVWASTTQDAFAVGPTGAITHYNGADWTTQASGSTAFLWKVWGTGGSDVFAVGTACPGPSCGTILHYDGEGWFPQTSGTASALFGVWGAGNSDVFAVGDGGTILHYNGDDWTEQESGTLHPIYGVWGTSGTNVFAVGGTGTILHYDGESWTAQPSGTTSYLYGIWGTASGDTIFVVGDGGTVLRHTP